MLTRKLLLRTFLLPLLCLPAMAQMPTQADAAAKQPQPNPATPPPANGEPVNPHIFGLEIPLLDPASDTVSYAGGKFDVGNNALVRARFETYLHQDPNDIDEAREYLEGIEEILRETQHRRRWSKKVGGSEELVKVCTRLDELSGYPGDADHSGTLASAMTSAMDAHRNIFRKEQRNKKMDREIDKLVLKTNSYNNSRVNSRSGEKHEYIIGFNKAKIAAQEAKILSNEAANEATLALAKVNFQSVLLGFLLQRRFDHALIGARCYRHLFTDGDTKLNLNEDSDAGKLFDNVGGMAPTVNAVDMLASAARSDVEHNIEAVYGLLAQNRLASATQHLIQAVAIGEYMQCVATFPREHRQRIAKYWDLRKRSLTALNARDYSTAEGLADEMKAMDANYDDSMLRGYCAGRMRQSDFCIRNAMKALQEGKDEEFRRFITEATSIWPLNPRLEEGAAKLAELDNKEPVKDEFRQLFKAREYRRIFDNQPRYEVVAIDPELRDSYKEAVTLVSTIDVLLAELHAAAEHDKVMGPCMAYEKLTARQKSDERFSADDKFRDALHNYAVQAHDFVQALEDAAECEKRREYGSALASYYRAQCLYPASELAKEGVSRVTDTILSASY